MDATRAVFASNPYFKQAWDAFQIINPLATSVDYINLCRSAAKSMDITNDWRTKTNPFSANVTAVDDVTTSIDLSLANAATKTIAAPAVHARPKKSTSTTDKLYSTTDLVDFLHHGLKNPNGSCKFHPHMKNHTASQCSEFVKYKTRLGGM